MSWQAGRPAAPQPDDQHHAGDHDQDHVGRRQDEAGGEHYGYNIFDGADYDVPMTYSTDSDDGAKGCPYPRGLLPATSRPHKRKPDYGETSVITLDWEAKRMAPAAG